MQKQKVLKLFALLVLIGLGQAGAMIKLKDFRCPPGQHIVDVDEWGSPICGS